jgi:hypothetical protein
VVRRAGSSFIRFHKQAAYGRRAAALPDSRRGRYDEAVSIAQGGRAVGSRCDNRSLAVDADIAYFVTYPCPRCKVELETEHGGWQGWLKCPACGTPALPPEFLRGHPSVRRRVREIGDGEAPIVIIGDDTPDGAPASAPSPKIAAPPSTLMNTLRLVFISGLVTSLFLLLIAYFDENQRATYLFGPLAVVFFLLLLRMPARRRKRM